MYDPLDYLSVDFEALSFTYDETESSYPTKKLRFENQGWRDIYISDFKVTGPFSFAGSMPSVMKPGQIVDIEISVTGYEDGTIDGSVVIELSNTKYKIVELQRISAGLGIPGRVDALETSVTGLTTSVTSINTSITTLNAAVDAVEADVAANTADITAVETLANTKVATADLASVADNKGAEMVGVQRPNTYNNWAQPKTALDYILDSAVSISEINAVADFNFATSTGTNNSTTALQNLLNDPKVGTVFIPPTDKAYMFGSTIELPTDTSIVGVPTPKTHSTTLAAPMSKIAFIPTGLDKVAIKAKQNTGTIWGQGVQDIAVYCNNFDHNGIQFYYSYSNAARNVSLFGKFNVGVLAHYTYVTDISGLYSSGLAEFKNAVVMIGDNNGVTIRGFHSGAEPDAVGDRVYGILCNGLVHGIIIDNAVIQGHTVGIHLGGSVTGATILNPYFENVVTNIVLGYDTTGPNGVSLIGGTYAGPYPAHPQYANRGPIILNNASKGLVMTGYRFEFQPNPASTTGPWGMVCGQGAAHIQIGPGSIYNDTNTTNNGSYADLLMLANASYSPTYKVDGFDVENYGEAYTLQKVSGAYGGVGRRISMDNTGAWVTAAYTPTVIPAAVNSLLTPDAPTHTSLLR